MRKMTDIATKVANGGAKYRYGCSGGRKHGVQLGGWTTYKKASALYQTHRSHRGYGACIVRLYCNNGKILRESTIY